ncbi:hypothetical protein [Pantoea septica]|uniref:hypothetical protein n=1 Tax=Pantoea septica TaxID=472695 RepID=UPI0023F575B9|nr:hypothetical protein [Pantoea septica]
MSECLICGSSYADDDVDDRKLHADRHKKLAKGVLPLHIREFMKQAGYAVAHNDGGLERMKNEDAELAKLAIAYSWWHRALDYGVPTKDFDAYMKAHLQFADSIVSGVNTKKARLAIQKWSQYAG